MLNYNLKSYAVRYLFVLNGDVDTHKCTHTRRTRAKAKALLSLSHDHFSISRPFELGC